MPCNCTNKLCVISDCCTQRPFDNCDSSHAFSSHGICPTASPQNVSRAVESSFANSCLQTHELCYRCSMAGLRAHKLGAEKELGFAVWEPQKNLEPMADPDSRLPAHPLCYVWGSGTEPALCQKICLRTGKSLSCLCCLIIVVFA